jgi:choline monooxygenase
VTTDAASLTIGLEALDITASTTIGSSFMNPRLYLAPEVYEADVRSIFPDSWVLIGDLSDLAGSMLQEVVGDRHVVVAENADGSLAAVSAGPCRSRIGPSAGEDTGADGCLICEQISLTDELDLNRLETLGARRIAVEVWERFVFANPRDNGQSLEEYLDPLPTLLKGHGISLQHPIASLSHDAACNWKLLVDNGFCDYHVPFVHERLMPLIQPLDTWGQQVSGNVTILSAPLTEMGRAGQPLHSGVVEANPGAADLSMAFGLYPNVLILGFRTGAVHMISWWPTGVGSTEVRVTAYDHVVPDADDVRYGHESIDLLQREDIGVCELVQKGIESGFYHPGPRHRLETRVLGFQERYLLHLERALQDEDPSN